MTPQEARERVARGAALLDEKRPGWAGQINTSILDIACAECVLFQLGGYSQVAIEIGLPDSGMVGSEHGFFVPDGESASINNPSWERLKQAWLSAIAERLTPPVTWTHRDPVVATGDERCELAGAVRP